MKILAAVLVFGLFAAAPSFAGGDSEISRATLQGIRGVHVLIEHLDPTVERAGLRSADLKTDVELKLRLAGIPVLSESEWLAEPGSPILVVTIGIQWESDLGVWPYDVEAELVQRVNLERVPKALAFAGTWSIGVIGSVGKLKVGGIRDNVKDLVDKFINAYLSVNPKK